MRSDGEKQLLVFFNLNLQQKITFLEMIDLHYLTEVSIFYGLKKKKNCAIVSKRRGSTTHVKVCTYFVSFSYS